MAKKKVSVEAVTITAEADGWRYAQKSLDVPKSYVFDADWVIDWEDINPAQQYQIHLFYGIKYIGRGDVPDFSVVFTANKVKRKMVRLGDLVAQWLDPGFYSVHVVALDQVDPPVSEWTMYVE